MMTVEQIATERAARKHQQLTNRRDDYLADYNAGKAPPQSGWVIDTGDCIERLAGIQDNRYRLIFADPPYNQGIDYGQGRKADSLHPVVYYSWCQDWLEQCKKKLTPDGSIWLMVPDEHAAELAFIMKRLELHLRNWIIWHESFGPHCTQKFSRTKRHLLWFTRSPKEFIFNRVAITVPSMRQVVYQDSRASRGGKTMGDVWDDIPRLCGTHAERIPQVPTQLPVKLLRRIVQTCSQRGDCVLDPMCGSGTTGEAALLTGRQFTGIEKNPDYASLAMLRLAGVRPEVSPAMRPQVKPQHKEGAV